MCVSTWGSHFHSATKWNLTEKKITSCSFQWVDIILFSCPSGSSAGSQFFIYLFYAYAHTRLRKESGRRWKKLPESGRNWGPDRCRRLSGCLTDSQKWAWPVGVGGVVKNGGLLFFVLFYVAFIRVFLSSCIGKGEYARTANPASGK